MDPLNIGKLDSYVNDFSSVLPVEKRVELNELFAAHESGTTEQVVVVLFPHRQGHELKDIGLKVFNENGIGQKGKNNGLLLLISTEEKKIRIITGKGMEIKYSEMRCRDIIENHLRPLLSEGKYEELLRNFSKRIQENVSPSDGNQEPSGYTITLEEEAIKNRTIKRYIITGSGLIVAQPILMFLLPFPLDVATIFMSIGIGGIIGSIFLLKNPQGSHKVLGGIFFLVSLLFILPTLKTYYCYNKTDLECRIHIEGYTNLGEGGGSYESSSSSSDWGSSSSSSDWDSGGSSFGGGGGSSNGGGGGD